MNLVTRLICALPVVLPSCGQQASPIPEDNLGAAAQRALEGTALPGVAIAWVTAGEAARVGAAGVRKYGTDAPFTAKDQVHIGSDTKAMTAVMLGRLVDRGVLDWALTPREAFQGDAEKLHGDLSGITLAQLMRHTAGLPRDAPDWSAYGRYELEERRRKIALDALAKKPLATPGTRHHYSNLSVMIAGAMAEAVTQKSWEELMREEVFEPLGMESAGFGVPGEMGELDQPWGHLKLDETTFPVQADNDPAMGPAGTVHLSMEDWGKFMQVFLKGSGKVGGEAPFLSPATLKEILTPGKDDYAMGWSVVQRPWAGGTALNHAGSNTMWFANAWVAPEKGVAFLTATNTGVDEAPQILDALTGELMADWQAAAVEDK